MLQVLRHQVHDGEFPWHEAQAQVVDMEGAADAGCSVVMRPANDAVLVVLLVFVR